MMEIMRLKGAFDPGLLKSSLKLGQSWAHDRSGADEKMILILNSNNEVDGCISSWSFEIKFKAGTKLGP